MTTLRELASELSCYPPVLFVHQNGIDAGREFFDRFWPEARAVSDEELDFYRAFGLGRGTPGQLLGAGVWPAALRAAFQGAVPGRPSGDVRLMSGAFLVEGSRVLRAHVYRHSGDHPDYRVFVEA